MDLPIYCVVEGRPVKVVEADDGGVEVWLFDTAHGDFVRRGDLLERVLVQDDGVVELNEPEFEEVVRKLSARVQRRVS